MNKGIVYGLTAYGLWGLFPIYWKFLQGVPAQEILAHRMAWSLVVVLLLLAARREWSWLRPALKDRRLLLLYFSAAALLSLNWFVYIWAVNDNKIIETSLGYFINPLVNVALGLIFLQEKLRPAQWVAVGLAAAGVLYLTVSYGQPPWIALTLACSFGVYGLLKRKATLPALPGFSLETALIFLPAFGYLLYLMQAGQSSFATGNTQTTVLLATTGIFTTVPLLCFAAAAQRVTLATLGVMQYIAPTLQFLLGVFVYGESFNRADLVGFCFIWLALAVYSAENIVRARRTAVSRKLAPR